MTTVRHEVPRAAVESLRETWPDLPWDRQHHVRGAFHHVIILPPAAAVRVRTGRGHAGAVCREASTARVLASAGIPVPRPLFDPVHTEQWSATAFDLVGGTAREGSTWGEDREGILSLFAEWADAGHRRPELSIGLPAARSWCGGEGWPLIVERLTAADPEICAAARQRIVGVLEVEASVALGAVHGDFGPHNLLWSPEGNPTLIDTDHAAWADPAIDVAPLLAYYPCDQLSRDVPRDLLDRGAAHRRTLSLQVAAAAELSGDSELRDHALANFTRRIRSGDPQW